MIWEQGLPCAAMGSPTIDTATGLVAVPTYACSPATSGAVPIFAEATGSPLATVGAGGAIAAESVLAEGRLYVAGETTGLTALGP